MSRSQTSALASLPLLSSAGNSALGSLWRVPLITTQALISLQEREKLGELDPRLGSVIPQPCTMGEYFLESPFSLINENPHISCMTQSSNREDQVRA